MQFCPWPFPRRLVTPDVHSDVHSLVWHVINCWVSRPEQDKLHVTMAIRKVPVPASESNNDGSSFAANATDQASGHSTQVPPLFPGAASDNQDVSTVWRVNNCWVSHAEQDGLHVTIALGRFPDLEIRTLTISVG
jgi:hypothetical protein